MYYKRLETNRFAKEKHDEGQKAAAAFRLKEVARKVREKKAKRKEAQA